MKLLRNADWMRRLTVVADDERARQHHPEVDNQHLFLGLLALGGPVTRALADAGVTLDGARSTFAALHSDRIAGLGVRIPATDPDAPIPPRSERGDPSFSPRAMRLLQAIPFGPSEQASLALWTALRADPSVEIDAVLTQLGADPVAVDGAARAYAETLPTEPSVRARAGTWSNYRVFVSAPSDEVWDLVADPERWMEWNASEHSSAEVLPDGVIEVHHPKRRRNGTTVRGDSPRALSHYEETQRVTGELIEWRRTSPGTEFSWLFQVALSPSAGGTLVELAYRYGFPDGRRGRLLGIAGRRLIAFTGGFYLRTKADDISRALG